MIFVEEGVRKIETNGADILLEKRGPFDFWYVKFPKGEIPASLGSAFTTPRHAEEAVINYLKNHPKRSARVDGPSE